jgi:small subunit ribosomal protein S8
MVTDSIADLFTRIRNAQRAGHKSVRVSVSKFSWRVLEVLKQEGLIAYFETKPGRDSNFEEYEVGLKYYSTGEPAITNIVRASTPGRRRYVGVDKLGQVQCGLGLAILSTPEGVMSGREARKRKLGGELIATVS